MSRTRIVIVSAAAAAALLVGGVAYGNAMASASRPGPVGPPSGGPMVDDSVFAAALGGTSDDPSASGLPGADGHPPTRGHMGLRHGPMMGMGQWVLHGEAVVKGRDGAFVTVATQSGEVTAVDASSVTVTSEDGYRRTWSLTDATRYWGFPAEATKADLKVGADVRVAGSVDEGKATARIVWFPPEPGTFPHRSERPEPGGSERPAPDGSKPGTPQPGSPRPSPSASTDSASTPA